MNSEWKNLVLPWDGFFQGGHITGGHISKADFLELGQDFRDDFGTIRKTIWHSFSKVEIWPRPRDPEVSNYKISFRGHMTYHSTPCDELISLVLFSKLSDELLGVILPLKGSNYRFVYMGYMTYHSISFGETNSMA